MAGPDDEVLAALDPTLRDAPPAPGSPRYQAILERAMTQTLSTAPTSFQPAPAKRRWKGWTAAAAGLAAAAVAAVMVLPGQTPSAAAAVLTASDKTAKATTGRAQVVNTGDGAGTSSTANAEFNGADVRIVYPAHANGTMIVTMLGDKRITSTPGGAITNEVTVPPSERFTPFARSAADVVRAALSSAASVQKIGTEKVRGAEATHYRVKLTATSRAALGKLSPSETFWFDLEAPGDVATVDVWVADDLIRRVKVAGDRNSTTEFWDFGSRIEVKRPGR
jgi:hypothetical protein